jgi:lactoylglutathione lyase
MFKIEHIAFWVTDLETVKNFYTKYFNLTANEKYTNTKKQFESYFLSFPAGGARIELMRMPGIPPSNNLGNTAKGLAHFAITVGTAEDVNSLTERLRIDGYTIASEPRRTGDGYYESAVLDPEGNFIELAAE